LAHWSIITIRFIELLKNKPTQQPVHWSITPQEQDLLEQLLDETKPPYKEGTQQLHYLISTPFRYPPLKYGSRFGDRTMPSFFYASETPQTVLGECAYYRFAFMAVIENPI
jgi:hypothetical protein